MPSETTPRILAAFTSPSPGSRAPGGANAARTPATALGAPQTTE
jgi:hypothetical protein